MAEEKISKEVVESYIFSTVRHDFGIYSERLLLRLVELAQREINGLDFKGGTSIGKVKVGEWGDATITIPVKDILSGEERSASALGHIAAVQTARFAWKTGTSAAFRDAWTIAWNPEFVVGVWCGHKSGHFGDTQVVGAHAAAPACWELARALYPSREGPWFPPSPEIVTREICAESGLPAAPECPVRKQGRALRERSSNVLCTLHRTGLDGTAETRHDAFVGAFTGKVEAAARRAIQKPDDNTTVRLVPGLTSQRIVCSVVGNPASGRLWWFVDGRPSGETNGSQKFVWTPEIGTHRISCSAANGVSASVTIHVVTE